MKHILAVDDDPALRAMVAEYLADQNFRVTTATSRHDMTRVLAQTSVDLIVLDLKLPEEDGLQLVRDIRARSEVPIIIVTGHRREEADRVVGLELGADDYLTKPFSLRELVARIRAVLRRSEAAASRPAADKRGRCRFAGWELNLRSRRLAAPDGGPVPLTRGEFALLVAFLEAPQRVLTREQLLAATRVHDADVYDRSIDVQILRLRRKLEANPSHPALIRTERGTGYMFATAVELV